jgi:transcriptional regulator with XRE-family HTH domain
LEKKVLQSTLAERLGITTSSYSRIENGEVQISINNLKKIADTLEVSLQELLNQSTGSVYNFNNSAPVLQQGHHLTLNVNLTPEQFEALEQLIKPR